MKPQEGQTCRDVRDGSVDELIAAQGITNAEVEGNNKKKVDHRK